MTIAQIIHACIKGDAQGQRQLVNQFAPLLLTIARRYASQRYGAQDILQDSFIKIFKAIDQYDDSRGSFEGWMRKITVNTALAEIRKHKLKFSDTDENHKNLLSIDPDVYGKLGAEELMEVIALLPEKYRIVFNLSCIEGYSHKEIAAILEIEEASSRSNLSRAKSILRKKLLANQNTMSWVRTA
jgi:RNA polymerase sigma-70 factor (ECF subfamily)